MTTKAKKARKARGDSKLDTLPPEKKAELINGLLCGWTYVQAADWLRVECGCSVSGSAWTPFYERNVEPILLERKKFAALSARTLVKMAEESEAFDAAAIGELREYAYRLIRDPSADPEEARKWMETLIRAQAGTRTDRALEQKDQLLALKDREVAQKDELLKQAERRVAIFEKKAAFYDAVKKSSETGEGGITAEEMAEIERRLKLL